MLKTKCCGNGNEHYIPGGGAEAGLLRTRSNSGLRNSAGSQAGKQGGWQKGGKGNHSVGFGQESPLRVADARFCSACQAKVFIEDAGIFLIQGN